MQEKKIKSTVYVRSICDHCGGEAWKKKANIHRHPGTFCSLECINAHKRTSILCICANPVCKKEFFKVPAEHKRSKSGDHFCSRSCATVVNNKRHKSGDRHSNWVSGVASYRRRAIAHYGAECSNPDCEIRRAGIPYGELMLDAHHLVGRHDNSLNNLRIFCVWCHAQITRGILKIGE